MVAVVAIALPNPVVASSRRLDNATATCLQTRRVVLVGDSTSRYEYEQIAHLFLGTDTSALAVDPIDVWMDVTRLPQWARNVPVPPANCDAFAIERNGSKRPLSQLENPATSAFMYRQGMLKKREVACDCSPGSPGTIANGFQNRVFTFGNGGFMAYFQLRGDMLPVSGTVSLQHLMRAGSEGVALTPHEMPCPVGVERPATWQHPPDKLLAELVAMRPTHVILNMGHWVFSPKMRPAQYWHRIAIAAHALRQQFGTTLLWRTHPLPKDRPPKRPFLKEENFRAATEIFLENGWQLYDAAGFVAAWQGSAPNSAAFNPRDNVHLGVAANEALSRFLLRTLCNTTEPPPQDRQHA